MKKILFFFCFITSYSVYGQNITVDSFTVGRDYVATVYLSDGSVENIRAIINPGEKASQRAIWEGRQGILLSPPVKPGGYENGSPVGPTIYNPGFTRSRSYLYIVEGTYKHGTNTIEYKGRFQQCIANVPNEAEWLLQYNAATKSIPDFRPIVASVTKSAEIKDYITNIY